ncbi:hypothetical protein [Microbacterium sp. 1.5R]|uniref:hypothetical protein n=1 Tax=Microbacterium sp. 1.5R TaxID=1916917 RepID=UPI00119FE0C3|nr:hypothetical protein [Microbacterium sp. 1.5R]
MTGPAYGNRNRATHAVVVDLVRLALDARGITSTATRTPTSLSDALSEDVALAPDLALDGVDLRVSSKLKPFRLAEDLEQAQRVAAIRGTGIGAVVQWRERPIDEAFVILDLRDFAKLLADVHRTPPP